LGDVGKTLAVKTFGTEIHAWHASHLGHGPAASFLHAFFLQQQQQPNKAQASLVDRRPTVI
jgi:hypothetical protein